MREPPIDSKMNAANEPLNPALKKEQDETYDPELAGGTDPMKTVSVTKDEGRAWPWVWAVAVIICVVVTLAIFIF